MPTRQPTVFPEATCPAPCGRVFLPHTGNQKYCSRICQRAGEAARRHAQRMDESGPLQDEITWLREALRQLLDCTDPRCSLCAKCIGLLQRIEPKDERPTTPVDEDDPIRTWRVSPRLRA